VRAGHAREKNQGINNSHQAHQTPTFPRLQTPPTPTSVLTTTSNLQKTRNENPTRKQKQCAPPQRCTYLSLAPLAFPPPETRLRGTAALSYPAWSKVLLRADMGRENTTASTEPDERTIQNTPASRRGCVNDEAAATSTIPGSSVSVRAGMEAREPRAQTAHEQRRLQERGTQSTGRITRTWHGKAGTQEGGMQEMEWSGVEKWLIEYVRTPGLFCKGRTCGEKKK
jgi:hypothetical protein